MTGREKEVKKKRIQELLVKREEYVNNGEIEKEIRVLRELKVLFRRLYGGESDESVKVLTELGNALKYVGKFEESIRLLTKAEKIVLKNYGENTMAFVTCNANLAEVYRIMKKYEKVVDIETLSLSMDLYRVKKGIQIATVRAELLLREFKDNKIKNRKEFLKLQLEKSEHCKTQAVCAPSILKCTKCGGNLSLLEGKICKFCGNELDMKEHDWVITEYSSMQEQK